MKNNQSIWDYYKDNLITPLSFVSDVGDNLDDDLSKCNTSGYEQVIEEISSIINSQLKESAKFYRSLTPEEKRKWDKLQAKLDELCKVNFTPRRMKHLLKP